VGIEWQVSERDVSRQMSGLHKIVDSMLLLFERVVLSGRGSEGPSKHAL